MFEQHPVPQQISSYQFRLVGDMTIKQFFQLAGGALIALLFYASSMPAFLKWPFIAFFSLAGAAFAFLPLEERPLDQWVVSFFRSIYSPTIFSWQRLGDPARYFTPDTGVVTPTIDATSSPAQESAIAKNDFLSNLEEAEKNILSGVMGMFSGTHRATSVATVGAPVNLPPVTPPTSPQPKLVIPQSSSVQVEKSQEPVPAGSVTTETAMTPQLTRVEQTFTPQETQSAQVAQFSPDAAPPTPPTQPNIVVGQIMDAGGHIVENAILEIKDTLGRPVRALKTNKAGHFLIVTPLASGTYKINIDKEGLNFDPIELTVTGAIIPPIAIRAKS